MPSGIGRGWENERKNLPVPAAQSDADAFNEWRRGKGMFKSRKKLFDLAHKEANTTVLRHIINTYGLNEHALDTLYLDIYNERQERAAALIETGLVNVNKSPNNVRNFGNYRCLHIACDRGQTRVVKALIKNDAFINALNAYDATPLMLAVSSGRTEIVDILLSVGANQSCGETYPLVRAAANGYAEIVDLLLQAGGDPEYIYDGHSLGYYAYTNEHFELAEKLGYEPPVPPSPNHWSVNAAPGHETVVKQTINENENITIRHIFDFNAQMLYTEVTIGENTPNLMSEHFREVAPEFLNEAKTLLEEKREQKAQAPTPKFV